MKKILFLFILVPFLALSQKDEKTKLRYDTLTKTLSRERTIIVTEIIDTARINSEITRLEVEDVALHVRIDSLRAQRKEAQKLITGKKDKGNNRSSDPAPAPPKPEPVVKQKTKKTGKQ